MTQTMAEQVAAREKELLGDDSSKIYDAVAALDHEFIRECFETHERGDGHLLATLMLNHYLFVTRPDDKGSWYIWDEHVWQLDEYGSCFDFVDWVAKAYEEYASGIKAQRDKILEELADAREIEINEIKQKFADNEAKTKVDKLLKKPLIPPPWMPKTIKIYENRAGALRKKAKMVTALFLAPKVNRKIATVIDVLDQKEWLLPAANGVIDLQRGVLVDGRPEDLLTKRIDVCFDPGADYTFWQSIVDDICIDPDEPSTKDLPVFLKRLFGSAISGKTNDEILAIFLGPGRNGKGTILGAISNLLGPFFHEANRSLFIEQRNEPPPSATSEHMFALLGKRLVVGAETNKGQKIDGGLVKKLTGGDKLNYRRNYDSEKNAKPTHTLMLETNNIPYGLTKEFALLQRLVLIELSFRYVDDIKAEEKKYPALKGRFKQKDPFLKDKLKSVPNQEGILKWLVEGCLEWQKDGLNIPDCILKSRAELMRREDYLGEFLVEIVEHCPNQETMRMPLANFYKAFEYYWREFKNDNSNDKSNKTPHKNTISKAMREMGYIVEKKGGVIRVHHFKIRDDVAAMVPELEGL